MADLQEFYDTKRALRKQLKAQREAFSAEHVQASSQAVTELILASDAYRKAQCIMGYLAFGTELNIDDLLAQALADGKTVVVPLVVSRTEMQAVRFTGFAELELDRYGIRSVKQPVTVVKPEQIDLVLVPGLAFGRDGSRMGMGAGYYDRFLPQAVRAHLIGLAYDALMQDSVPHDDHDFIVPQLVSESGFLNLAK